MSVGIEPRAPIIQYWHSAKMPDDVAELTATLTAENPDSRHLVFSEATADSFIAEHLSDRELSAFRSCAVPAMQADYFRYCAAYAIGGIYLDVDYRCVCPLEALLEMTECGLLFQRSNGAVVNGFFVFKTARHPLLRITLDIATANIEQRTCENVWWMTGPWIFTVLWEINRRDSLDAALRYASQHGVLSEVEQLVSKIEDHEQVVSAFKDMRVVPFEATLRWIAEPDSPPLYKRGKMHWLNWQERGASIFR